MQGRESKQIAKEVNEEVERKDGDAVRGDESGSKRAMRKERREDLSDSERAG